LSDDQAEKTEDATPKRVDDARRKGQVAQSRELQSVILLTAVLLVLSSGLAEALVLRVVWLTELAWTTTRPSSLADFHVILMQNFAGAGMALVPIIVLGSLAGAAAALVQIGPMLSWQVLTPRADRISLVKGFKRMVDLDRLFDLGKALFKVAVVGSITFWVIDGSLDRIIGLYGASLETGLVEAGSLARKVALYVLSFLAVMAAVDLVYQRMRHAKRLRMSLKEVRDEMKDREGNPHVRSRARALQRELTRSRMIASVAEASVVVTNPTHFAVALQYAPELSAPRVLAKGRNHVAKRIREVARENGVPIVENKPLAQILHRTAKVGHEIPEALFQAVAEVLAYVYRLNPARSLRRAS